MGFSGVFVYTVGGSFAEKLSGDNTVWMKVKFQWHVQGSLLNGEFDQFATSLQRFTHEAMLNISLLMSYIETGGN